MDWQSSQLAPTTVARKLPAWWTPFIFGIVSAVLVGIALIASPNLGVAAIIGAIVAFMLALAGIVTLFMGDAAERLQWGLAALILIVIGAGGLFSSSAAYRFSIKQEMDHGAYSAAIHDLGQIGQKPPYSTDLAQAYLDWAHAEGQQHAYKDAVAHLSFVAKSFPTTRQAAVASSMLPDTYLAWAQYAMTNNDPITAASAYQTLLTTYPTASATTKAHATAPAAFLAAGNAYYAAHYYENAYTNFTTLLKNFGQAPEATQGHAQAAKDLFDWAQKLTDAHLYNQASQHFQDLAQNYGDTEQGKQAQGLLGQGVVIIGRFLRADGSTPVVTHTTVRISGTWNVHDGTYDVSGRQYLADTDANGYFEFPAVSPGQYLLEWRSTSGLFTTIFSNEKPNELVTINPLEPVTLPPIVTDQK